MRTILIGRLGEIMSEPKPTEKELAAIKAINFQLSICKVQLGEAQLARIFRKHLYPPPPKLPPYLSVHPVAYVDLRAVEKERGKDATESLQEHLEQAAQENQMRICGFDAFCDEVDKSRETVKPDIIAFLDSFADQCRTYNATGDIIWS